MLTQHTAVFITSGSLSLRMGTDSFTSDSLVPNTSHPVCLSLYLSLCKRGISIPALLVTVREE